MLRVIFLYSSFASLNFLSFQELRSSCSAMLRKRHRVPSEGVKTLVQLSAMNCQIVLK
jgi:hypothetical protein